MEVRFEVYSVTLNYIYKLKLGLGTFGKDYGSVLNVDQKDFFLLNYCKEFRIQRQQQWLLEKVA